jgi:hypothetical protein
MWTLAPAEERTRLLMQVRCLRITFTFRADSKAAEDSRTPRR